MNETDLIKKYFLPLSKNFKPSINLQDDGAVLQNFKKDVDARIAKGESKDEAILKELQKMIKESKKIRFEGNGYGEEWVKEAEKRC